VFWLEKSGEFTERLKEWSPYVGGMYVVFLG
jgi:hypothetical protein